MSKITRAIKSDLKEPGFEKKKAAALISDAYNFDLSSYWK